MEWQGSSLFSRDFGDIYFSTSGGREESEAVYLAGNGLIERFSEAENFVIGELGFGTTLNFALTAELWKKHSRHGGTLFYLAFERAPVPPRFIEDTLQSQGIEQTTISEILSELPPAVEGLHVIDLPNFRVRLLLNYGDALEKVGQMRGRVDAWFLDGFSPSKNPVLWSETVLRAVTELSGPGTTLGTYSVARSIREQLQRLGWNLQKVSGPRGKRQVLRGVFDRALSKEPVAPPRRVAVIGGGLAGCSVIDTLRRRGAEVTLFERRAGIALGASGNFKGVVLPYPSKIREPRNLFYAAGFLSLLRVLKLFGQTPEGLIFSPIRDAQGNFFEMYSQFQFPQEFAQVVEADEASELAGVRISSKQLYFPHGGAISFPTLCANLAEGVSISERRITADNFEREVEGFDAVVICTGYESDLLPTLILNKLQPLQGSVGFIRGTEVSLQLRLPICTKGYVLPAQQGYHFVGSTYEKGIVAEIVPEASENSLREICGRVLGTDTSAAPIKNSRASVRATTLDRFPIVGRIPAEYSRISQPSFLSVGHGSRGGVSAFLSAEYLAAEIFGEPSPLEEDLICGIAVGRWK